MAWLSSPVMRSALRATVTVTALFAGLTAVGLDIVATFATFASVALLLFADFPGSARDRTVAYLGATATGAVVVVLGSLASVSTPVAVAATFVVALAVQTASVLGGSVAKARMPLLLAWVLPVTLPFLPGQALSRGAGWLVGGVAALLAALVLWPTPGAPQLRAQVTARARWLLDRLQTVAAGGTPDPTTAHDAPPLEFRPFGTTVRDHELHRCAEALSQLGWFVDRIRTRPGTGDAALLAATADALRVTTQLVGDTDPPDREPTLQRLVAERDAHLHALVADSARDVAAGAPPTQVLDAFAGVLPLRVGGILAIESALHAERSRSRPGPDPYLGSVPGLEPEPGPSGIAGRFVRLLGSAMSPGSVWLRVSMRVAVGLAAAVLIALLSGVDHGFWVALGTLSVLRSTAFATGRTYLLAVVGTLLGFVVSSAVVAFDEGSGQPLVLWIAFPVTVFLSAYAPAAWHYVAGQAAFTAFVVVMFSLLEPAGLATGITRVEDVVIGGAVSVVTGALLWPFGTRHRLRAESASLLRQATVYLSDGLSRAIDRRAQNRMGADRDALLLGQWRTETALQEYAAESSDDARPWRPVLGTAARLRLVADLLERAAEYRAPAPGHDLAAGLAPAADGIVGDVLLVAAEVESARRLRLIEDRTIDAAAARDVAASVVASWGGDTADEVTTWDAVATTWTYVWLGWVDDTIGYLSRTLDGSPVLDRPIPVHA